MQPNETPNPPRRISRLENLRRGMKNPTPKLKLLIEAFEMPSKEIAGEDPDSNPQPASNEHSAG